MIHFLTAHRGDRWVKVQLAALSRHLREPYTVWASVEDVRAELAAEFDHAIPMLGGHPGKLNLLWRIVEGSAADDDLVVFLDSDSLLIADPVPRIRGELERHVLVAVRRTENDGDPQPHPCFAAATAAAWRSLKCDWDPGHVWRTSSGRVTTDVGANLLYELERKDIPWLALDRGNTVDLHPVFFAVYGGLVYHHGAGSRRFPLERPETLEMPWRKGPAPLRFVLNVPVAVRRRRRMRRNRRMSEEVFRRLVVDPEFWTRFAPGS